MAESNFQTRSSTPMHESLSNQHPLSGPHRQKALPPAFCPRDPVSCPIVYKTAGP
ncbi:hypothetical protein [uncultured Acetatifactor sp.]|uniref:hypothetical protein n=1 Tax=uncultured Acetatifactor sp. TaxID=1671927 RepID=UPI002FE6E9AE